MNFQLEQQLIKQALSSSSLYISHEGIDYKVQWIYDFRRNGYYLIKI